MLQVVNDGFRLADLESFDHGDFMRLEPFEEVQLENVALDLGPLRRRALQELDETSYWLELTEILPGKRLKPLHSEAGELMAILVTIVTKVKRKDPKRNR